MSLIIILRLTATGSQELQYVPSCRGSETQYFSFFPPFENTAWEWSRHLEAHEYIWGTEEVQGGREGSENESWGRGFTLQLNQANRSLLPKKGGPIFTFLSFLTFHCWQNKSHPSLAAALIWTWTWWTGSALRPRRKQFTFFIVLGKSAFSKLKSCFLKARHMATEPGARHDYPS